MNDIYEYKARKYKYKYLKLKREYMGEGGAWGRVTKNKVRNILDMKLLPIDKSKIKEINNSKAASNEQKNFRKKLISLRNSIDISDNINNIIYGNIYYYDIFYHGNEPLVFTDKMKKSNSKQAKLIINDEISLKIHKKNKNEDKNYINIIPNDISIVSYDISYRKYLNYIFKKIDTISYPPLILLHFCNIYKRNKSLQEEEWKSNYNKPGHEHEYNFFNDVNTIVKDYQLYKEFTDLNEATKHKFYENLKKYNIKRGNKTDTYTMSDLFSFIFLQSNDNPDNFHNCIKNIHYYSIAMIINHLYVNFTDFFIIVENTTDKNSQQLPALFENLVKQYNNHEIEKVSFLEQFDKIISLIKE
jgi:hypothetical protein